MPTQLSKHNLAEALTDSDPAVRPPKQYIWACEPMEDVAYPVDAFRVHLWDTHSHCC